MKLLAFMKKRKDEEAPKSEKITTKNASDAQKEIKVEAAAPRSRELYFDDNDIGYC